MSTLSPEHVSESVAFRLANITRQRGKQLLVELGVQPVAVIGRVRIYPAATVGQLLAADNIVALSEAA